ncbi:MAG: stress-induced protein [Candidatus Berkelbacteria bacterium]|nr:MAG: stress-induced protein [Candidatus Berkelbacteria bacterium]QQG51610.1 MAG: stress-induced protein [Candidatus Berkelbacteria bacterium]
MARLKSKRGFASMDASTQRRIASAGGRAAHASGNAHQWTPKEASKAGKKGGRARKAQRRAYRP